MKKTRALLLTAALVGSIIPTALHQRAHAATCFGNNCFGQWPNQTGCGNDAQQNGSLLQNGNVLIVPEYSPTCNTKWTRVLSVNSVSQQMYWIISGGGNNLQAGTSPATTSWDGKMISAQIAQSCGAVSGQPQTCTAN